MNILQTTRHRTWLSVLFLIVATVIAYQPVWRAGFIWDDDMFLTNNAVLKSADGLYRLWFTASTPDYFPMTSSMLWCEWRIWGNHALGYHLVNVLLHAFSSVLLWRVLERLKIPRALLAAAIFALHPVNVESVAWITQRKNTLAMFFYVCVFLLYLRFEDTGKRRWYGLASIVFALALLSKTAVVPLPLVLLGIAWWRRGRVAWQDVRRSIVFFMVAAALAVVTIWFQSHRAIGSEVIRTDSFWSRLAGAGWAIWFYLYKAVLPLNLSFVYPLWQIDERKVLSYVPLLLLAAIFGWCWIYRLQWGRALLFGLGYFVVMLLPILGFLDIYFMCFSLVADHWQYFAIIGPIALAAAIIKNNLSATMLLLALGTLSWRQCLIYTDAETLWRTTISRNPDSILANNNFGVMLSDRGQLDDAIAHFQKILKIRSDDPDAHNNFGNALLRKGDVDGAIFHYQEALKSAPHRADVHYNFGNAFVQKGQLDQALVHFQRAWEIKPNYLEAYNNAGSILLKIGRINEAVACWLKALEINPRVALPHNNIGYALVTQGRLD
jgi:tetratricopeptide (TPR) repeat protein